MRYLLLPFTPRYILLTIAIVATLAFTAIALADPETIPEIALPLAVFAGLVLLGIRDLVQSRSCQANLKVAFAPSVKSFTERSPFLKRVVRRYCCAFVSNFIAFGLSRRYFYRQASARTSPIALRSPFGDV